MGCITEVVTVSEEQVIKQWLNFDWTVENTGKIIFLLVYCDPWFIKDYCYGNNNNILVSNDSLIDVYKISK